MKLSWPWPDSLDALLAAPDHHTLLLENDRVRVVRTFIPPGQTVPIHSHRWPGVAFVISWSNLVRRDPDGNVTFDSRQLDEAPVLNAPRWQEPLPPHSVQNVGEADINIVQIEIKSGNTLP